MPHARPTNTSSHTGAAYVEAISARRSDRIARSAFQELALQLARPGDAILDFGAGPGIDARFYAERGFTVQAYDVDPQMCAHSEVHCQDFIQAGQVEIRCGPYRDFLEGKIALEPRASLVTSNFAPLNLVDDLPALFERFHKLTQPGGRVLASVLSPYFVGDWRYRWWWQNSRRLLRDGFFSVQGVQAPIVRRQPANFADQCAPRFALQAVLPGSFRQYSFGSRPSGLDWHDHFAWLPLTMTRFMFLVFERLEYGVSGCPPVV